MTTAAIPSFRFFVPDSADFIVGVDWMGADFTAAAMTLTVYAPAAQGGATLLTASTDDGRIRIHDDGAGFDYFIPQAAIAAVPVGLQRLQQVMSVGGVTTTLFRGSWSTASGALASSTPPLVYDGFRAPIEFSGAPTAISLVTTGKPGASAYELWLAAGNRGTEADFLSSLQGLTDARAAALSATAQSALSGLGVSAGNVEDAIVSLAVLVQVTPALALPGGGFLALPDGDLLLAP